ncbi:MAG: transglutaminase domain-containing protein, partial [Bacteroidota bacterium]
VNVPDWMECRMEEFNFEGNAIDKQRKKASGLTAYTFKAKDIKVPTKENGAPARGKIYPHIMLIPEAYKTGNKNITLMPSTKELYSWYHSLVKSVDNNTSPLQEQVNQLTSGKTAPIEKIKAIFYWVQDNIRYIAFEHGIMGFQPEACQKVYNNKYGDCKGMANLTKEMLQLAGFDARLTWLGTNDVPYNYNYPSLYADNHMICTVILDGQKIFLDPTEKYANIYNYAHRIQGRDVLIEDNDNFIIAQVPSGKAQENEQKNTINCTIEEDLLKGQATLTYKGNSKTRFYNQINSISDDNKTRWLKNYLSNAEKDQKVSIDQLPDLSNRDEDLVIDYALEVNNRIIDLGKEKYLNPELDMEFKNFTVPEDRVLPYEFSNKYYINNTTTINLPSNWTSTYIPEPIAIANDAYSFHLNYQIKDNSIVYTKEIIIQDITIRPEAFKSWNESIKSLAAFYEDQLIFKVE